MGKLPYALQTYTVRDHMGKDVAETLKKIKEIGYTYVELGGTYGLTNAALKKKLDDAGMRAISVHTGFNEVTQNPKAVIDMARVFGAHYAVVGGIDPSLTPDRAGWLNCGEMLDEYGAELQKAGIQLCYHNHAHEFELIDGEWKLDILFEPVHTPNLMAQIDAFWVQYAGLDPAAVINKYRDRCPLLHVKDMADTVSRAFAEVGRGILDWPDIFTEALVAGTKWFIVEQDVCAGDSLESARISAEFMASQ